MVLVVLHCTHNFPRKANSSKDIWFSPIQQLTVSKFLEPWIKSTQSLSSIVYQDIKKKMAHFLAFKIPLRVIYDLCIRLYQSASFMRNLKRLMWRRRRNISINVLTLMEGSDCGHIVNHIVGLFIALLLLMSI